jgi:integrator complex subunit 4
MFKVLKEMYSVLSSLYPNHRMKLAHEQMDETTRLIDDAFNKVCDLINDASVVIRTKACVMMASYQQVGPNTLAQTFSKQIMSHLRRNVPRYKKQQKVRNGENTIMEKHTIHSFYIYIKKTVSAKYYSSGRR